MRGGEAMWTFAKWLVRWANVMCTCLMSIHDELVTTAPQLQAEL